MENLNSSPCTNAHSMSVMSAKNPTLVAFKTVHKHWNRRTLSRMQNSYASIVNTKLLATDKPLARSTDTILSIGSACAAAQWPCSFAVEALKCSVLLAIMMPWLKRTKSQTLALVVPIALLESHPTHQLRPTKHPASPWVAVFADQSIWN